MPELRRDPVTGRAVFIAEDRANRPNDFEGGVKGECPFCAGREAATPHESASILDADGRWLVRVVPNKYPIATPQAENGERNGNEARQVAGDGNFLSACSFWLSEGAHEVIIESPRHLRELTDLTAEELALVLRMFRDRIRHWAGADMRHALVFKNSGPAAGASLEHLHSQLVALPFVPQAVQAELDGAAAHFTATGRCIYCDLAEASERQVLDAHGFVAFTAVAGRQPYETWLLPQRHRARFDELSDDALPRLAIVLLDLIGRLESVAPGVAHNLVLHTGPFGGEDDDSYHWHWELIPRLTQLAGFEWGAGAHINPVSPEEAAERLRSAAWDATS